MRNEYQRRFHLTGNDWKSVAGRGRYVVQGYFTTGGGIAAQLVRDKLVITHVDGIVTVPLAAKGVRQLQSDTDDNGFVSLSKGFEARIRGVAERKDSEPSKAAVTLVQGSECERSKVKAEVRLEALELLRSENIMGHLIEKIRYGIGLDGGGGAVVEAVVDEYRGPNRGLMLLEVEVASKEHLFTAPPFELPAWIGVEVDGGALNNSRLAETPWTARAETSRAVRAPVIDF